MSKIRAIVYGVGSTGQDLAEYMLHNGVEIVGAIDADEDKVGRDLGEIIGFDRELGVEVRDDPEAVFDDTRADIATVAIATPLKSVAPHLERCARHGVNAITSSEEALYPWTTAPELASKLDRVAQDNEVTITGAGYQDIFWVNLVTMLTGASLEIDTIRGLGRFNLDDYGPVLAEHYYAGERLEDVQAEIDAGDAPPSFFRMNIESQIAALGVSLTSVTQDIEPVVAETDVESDALGRTIPEGDVVGVRFVVEASTDHGIDFVGEEVAKVYEPGETDINEWTIEGTPEIHVRNEDTPTAIGTSTQIVNRIPDILQADPGYVTVDELPAPRYRPLSLENYVE
ncbi:NAD(P)H-dependent amine dehydrogenase family protein [Natranaeroarchaeum sulfidigenes]|uniref:Dihydrodipicolinate reductase n=1 Tax=Natranaeroarchaeum sulfidigenes TaxID=2784880 RepID=A0A897MSF7_9EURY|nr:hypothetical protein [Natranaeroarchaeum sulfidigenes]QSG02968.1 Uncharacterized protein AArcS_1758 [Natranaeroarchaeum sulfidigenes]